VTTRSAKARNDYDVAAFGAQLGDFRRSAGLSQQELGERSGLNIRAISNLERGRARWPHLDSVHRLADALGLRDQARAQFLPAAAPADDPGRGWPGHHGAGHCVKM